MNRTTLAALSIITITTSSLGDLSVSDNAIRLSPRLAAAQGTPTITPVGQPITFPPQNNSSPIVLRYGGYLALFLLDASNHHYIRYSINNGQTWFPRPDQSDGPLENGLQKVVDFGDGEIFAIGQAPEHVSGTKWKYVVRRSLNNGNTWLSEFAELDQPDVPVANCPEDNGSPGICAYRFEHGLFKLRHGDLLACVFGHHTGDSVLAEGFPPEQGTLKTRLLVVNSSDRGRNWLNPRTLAYLQTPAREGFNECDIARAVNGDLVMVVRTSAVENEFPNLPLTPMYVLRSTDEGVTWSAPQQARPYGAWPSIVKLDNGLMVATYNGAGGYVAASNDNGLNWPVETTVNNKPSDTDMVQTGPDIVMVTHFGTGQHALTLTFYQVQGQGPPPLANNLPLQLMESGLCVNVFDSGLGAAPCSDIWRQRFVTQAVGSAVRFRLNGTNDCLTVGSPSGGVHPLTLAACGSSSQLFEATCLDRWRNPGTGAALVIEPTSGSAGIVYGLSGFSGYCADPLLRIAAIPLVTENGVLTPLANNQQNQLRGSNLCLTVQGPNDKDIGTAPCVNSWRQRLIAQQAGPLWRFRVNGTNDCLEPASQPSGGTYPLKIGTCGGSTTQYFERMCTDRWRNPVTGMSLVINGVTNTAYGMVFSGPCNEPKTLISPIAWVP